MAAAPAQSQAQNQSRQASKTIPSARRKPCARNSMFPNLPRRYSVITEDKAVQNSPANKQVKQQSTLASLPPKKSTGPVRKKATAPVRRSNKKATSISPKKSKPERKNEQKLPIERINPSDEEKKAILDDAIELQKRVAKEDRSVVISLRHSHVYQGFWLGIPPELVKLLPKARGNIKLVDAEGGFDIMYIPDRSGFSGGWRGYALERKLHHGDAIVLELISQATVKINVVRLLERFPQIKRVSCGTPDQTMKRKLQHVDANKKEEEVKSTIQESNSSLKT